jgi:hypothetical protein
MLFLLLGSCFFGKQAVAGAVFALSAVRSTSISGKVPMKIAIALGLLLFPVLLLNNLACAEEVPTGTVTYAKLEPGVASGGKAGSQSTGNDAQLEARKQEFFRFAQGKLRDMNRNHRLSRERMQIGKAAGGGYRATYHQIDDASMAFEVNRSTSKTIPYVAVLSYKEEIYAADCPTPEACRRGEFSPVGVIPNRHIFSFSNGSWK